MIYRRFTSTFYQKWVLSRWVMFFSMAGGAFFLKFSIFLFTSKCIRCILVCFKEMNTQTPLCPCSRIPWTYYTVSACMEIISINTCMEIISINTCMEKSLFFSNYLLKRPICLRLTERCVRVWDGSLMHESSTMW